MTLCVRYGSGYTLQAKINPAMVTPANIPNPTSEPPLHPLQTEPPLVNEEAHVDAPYNDPARTEAVSRAHGVVIDTTGLKYFIEQSFQGARLVEEHQVCVL